MAARLKAVPSSLRHSRLDWKRLRKKSLATHLLTSAAKPPFKTKRLSQRWSAAPPEIDWLTDFFRSLW